MIIRGSHRYKSFLANKASRLAKRKVAFHKKRKYRLECKIKGIPYTYKLGRMYKKCIRRQIVTKDIPENFNALNNHDSVFGFVGELLDMHSNRKLKEINLNLENIKSIDSVAICLLLTVVTELANHGINVLGNSPKDKACEEFFVQSGFLSHVQSNTGHNFNISHSNLIIETGKNLTRNKDIAQAIRKSMKNLLGEERRYQPAYTVAMEICTNSVEHAYINRPKHWKLSINKQDDKLLFTMVDTGQGILKTIYRKFWKEVNDLLTSKDKHDILYRAFQRKYGSSTQEINRNKGFPCIMDKYEHGYIKNLKVISNSVYLDFNNLKDKKTLINPFDGVLFYWEIDIDCIQSFDKDNNNNI